MEYDTLAKMHSKLSKTSDYSEKNKEVLNDYFNWAENESGDLKTSTIRKYASRWYTMRQIIDFQLDKATREDTSDLVRKINGDQMTKNDGSKYSASAKKKFINQITSFYNKFIQRKDRGYSKSIDGPLLVAQLTYDEKPTSQVNTETKANADDIKEVARVPDNLRDRAIILFMFSAGARIGEIFSTQDKPEYLKWKDITFSQDDTMEVNLRKNYKKEEPKRRTVNLVISKPIMEKLYDQKQPDLEDPVFASKDSRMFCPECSEKASQVNNATYQRRKYRCKSCGWDGGKNQCKSKKVPISDRRVRDIIKNAVQSAKVTPKAQKKDMDDTPHKLLRKSRALNKQALNWGDSPLRSFFGWEEGSSVPGRYKDALKVNQKQELSETFPNLDISIDGYFLSRGLDPIVCAECEHLNSRLWDMCYKCNEPVSYQGTQIAEPNTDSKINSLKHEAKNELIQKQTEDTEKVKKMLEDIMESKLEKSEI